tara:strand:- start:16 stop:963 length:948 start_codon:yes stop_codon:yes gene_type:complete
MYDDLNQKNFNILGNYKQELGVEHNIWPAIGAIAGIGGAIFGAIGSSRQESAQRSQIDAANRAARQQYDFDKKEINRTNKYRQESLKINKQNFEEQRAYQQATQDLNWQRQQYLQDFQYNNAKRAFAKSEENYLAQLALNKEALGRAYSDSQQDLNEVAIGQAFDKQDLNLRTMANAGQAQMGQAGNNMMSAIQAASAAKGRDLAVMNANLLSAVKQTGRDMGDARLDYLAANQRADAQRLLRPEMMDDIPKPLLLPDRVWQDPYELKPGPEPIDGIYTGPGIWGTLAQAAGGLSEVNWSAFGNNNNFQPRNNFF